MRAWYDILATGIGAQQDTTGIRASQVAIEEFIAQELAQGINPANIFLAGFSQGGAIALHTGLRHANRLGGILALSTYLPLSETLPAEANIAAKEIPIFMAHGHSDPIVPYSLGRASEKILLHHGYKPDWHEYFMPHSVCPDEVRDIEAWLTRRLNKIS